MYRRILIALALLLAMTCVVAAQKKARKTPSDFRVMQTMMVGNCWYTYVSVAWTAPEKSPIGYRIRWAPDGDWDGWRYKGDNHRGTMKLNDGTETRASLPNIQGVHGHRIHVQIRARYKGKNGPWATDKLPEREYCS